MTKADDEETTARESAFLQEIITLFSTKPTEVIERAILQLKQSATGDQLQGTN
jgi:hypothetical protein